MTEVDKCTKCGKREGFDWHYAKDSGMTTGYGTCKSCGVKYA